MSSLYDNKSVSNIFKKYISSKIPKKQTNIFFTLFNGIDTLFSFLELKLNTHKRERNFFTAQTISALRNLAAQNGFEPKLKVPSKGNVKIIINSTLFNKVGYPIYLPPYSVFINKKNNLEYYYESDKMLKIDKSDVIIPLVEGVIRNQQFLSSNIDPKYIERFYLQSNSLAENSISITVNNVKFTKVKSFYDNNGNYDNKQFIVKYSNDAENPLIIYIKGTSNNDIINVTYRECTGEYGNLEYKTLFESQEFLDSQNNPISVDETELKVFNIDGFNYGSDGSDVNSLKSAIGFNHGVNLLFDRTSYVDFVNKFSTVLLQDIILSEEYKAIKNIYISKKLYLNPELEIVSAYKDVIAKKSYYFSDYELNEFTKLLEDNEHALSSHNINVANTLKYAFQVKFNLLDYTEIDFHKNNISKILYYEFSKFFYDKNNKLNIEILFNKYMTEHNISLEYIMFNSNYEIFIGENTTITHIDKLPILSGDFEIKLENQETLTELYFDINWVINKLK